jgi:dephospho-CoA kinase
MLKIGITGGIGTGKTTVCRIFETLNVPVYYSDMRAKELMASNTILMNKLKAEFGNQVFETDGKLNTPYLASIVFSDPSKLKTLNNIVHPIVLDDFSDWCNKFNTSKYIILESAIIYESNIAHLLDYVILVDAPAEISIKRIVDRDGVPREAVIQRMKNQLTPDEKKSFTKLIIFNDGKQSLVDQVVRFHNDFSGN